MRGIGDELTQALLGFRAGLKRSLDVVDHGVQRKTDIANFISGLGNGAIDAIKSVNGRCGDQILGTDIPRGCGNFTQWKHFLANPLTSDKGRAKDNNQGDDTFNGNEREQGRIIRGQRQADNQRLGIFLRAHHAESTVILQIDVMPLGVTTQRKQLLLGFRIQFDDVKLLDDTGNHLIVVFDELQLTLGGSRSAKASGPFISRCCRWVRTGGIRGRGLSVIVVVVRRRRGKRLFQGQFGILLQPREH